MQDFVFVVTASVTILVAWVTTALTGALIVGRIIRRRDEIERPGPRNID